MSQLDMFARAVSVQPASDLPDPADVRARTSAKLHELQGADAMPWSERDLGVWRILWPQMSRWLPDEERELLIGQFDEQIARLTSN